MSENEKSQVIVEETDSGIRVRYHGMIPAEYHKDEQLQCETTELLCFAYAILMQLQHDYDKPVEKSMADLIILHAKHSGPGSNTKMSSLRVEKDRVQEDD
jgi:hypothetical protein